MEDTAVEVMFHPIDFGMLAICCPKCEQECTGVFVGMTTLEDERIEPLDGLPPLTQMGVVAYPCGDIFCSACLTERIALILNARDTHSLKLGMFHNLISCEEHGVDYPGQS